MTKAKHQRQLQERVAEGAELQLQTTALQRDVKRLTKLLDVAQRETAVHKQAAVEATARAHQRTKEARIQLEALRKQAAPIVVPVFSPQKTMPMPVLGGLPGFEALCAAYEARQQRGRLRCPTSKLRVALSSKPAVSRDPSEVAHHVGKLRRLAAAHGVTLAMEACGPGRWRVGGCTLTLHLADTRLMARTGGGYEAVLQALARLPA